MGGGECPGLVEWKLGRKRKMERGKKHLLVLIEEARVGAGKHLAGISNQGRMKQNTSTQNRNTKVTTQCANVNIKTTCQKTYSIFKDMRSHKYWRATCASLVAVLLQRLAIEVLGPTRAPTSCPDGRTPGAGGAGGITYSGSYDACYIIYAVCAPATTSD